MERWQDYNSDTNLEPAHRAKFQEAAARRKIITTEIQ